MSTTAVIVVVGLAAARVVRLWRDDAITEGLRERWTNRLTTGERLMGLKEWLLDLSECPWCLSAWVTAAFIIAGDSATSRSVDLPFLAWLASWWVACVGYWLAELIADRDALAYWERKNKGIG